LESGTWYIFPCLPILPLIGSLFGHSPACGFLPIAISPEGIAEDEAIADDIAEELADAEAIEAGADTEVEGYIEALPAGEELFEPQLERATTENRRGNKPHLAREA
jgi:hypothetical protein